MLLFDGEETEHQRCNILSQQISRGVGNQAPLTHHAFLPSRGESSIGGGYFCLWFFLHILANTFCSAIGAAREQNLSCPYFVLKYLIISAGNAEKE